MESDKLSGNVEGKPFFAFLAAQLFLCSLLMTIWPHLALDDSYIFLRYARQLAVSGNFDFNVGEPSYGFSSPAYVVLLAVASRFTHIPVGVALSNLLGLAMCCLATWATWELWGELGLRPDSRQVVPTAILLSGPWFYTVWFLFGMETGLAVLSLLLFLLWLAKLYAGASRFPWLLIGIAGAMTLAITRLESGIYIAGAILVALTTLPSKGKVLDLALVAICSGGAELAWLVYAYHAFGTYLPWTSEARLLYYIAGNFGLHSASQFYQMGIGGRSLIAAKALIRMIFGGPMKFLLLGVPLAAAAFLLRMRTDAFVLRWLLRTAVICTLVELVTFAYLFPLVQNRHLAPYFAGTWALLVPVLVQMAGRGGGVRRAGWLAVTAFLWIGGAYQYWHQGTGLEALHELAMSGRVGPTDRLAAEAIGIVSFETRAYIIDLGGLIDRDAWPLLMTTDHAHLSRVVAWEMSKGATKLLIARPECGPLGQRFGAYCLYDASAAATLMQSDQ